MQLFMHCGVHSVHDLKRGPCYKKKYDGCPMRSRTFLQFQSTCFFFRFVCGNISFPIFVLFLFYSSLALLCLSWLKFVPCSLCLVFHVRLFCFFSTGSVFVYFLLQFGTVRLCYIFRTNYKNKFYCQRQHNNNIF
jgi:hypothetical protein